MMNEGSLATPEIYKLRCCNTNKSFEFNDEIAFFKFTGRYNLENHPDYLQTKVISSFTTIDGNTIEGCFTMEPVLQFYEACEDSEFKFEEIFYETCLVDCCEDCLPEVVVKKPLATQRPNYPTYSVPNIDPYYFENLAKEFSDENYKKSILDSQGVKMCCPGDMRGLKIKMEIAKMDLMEDVGRCCPKCVLFEFSFGTLMLGSFTFRNCDGEIVTTPIDTGDEPLVIVECGCVNQLTGDIQFTGTIGVGGGSFTYTPLGLPCTTQ